MRHGFDAAALPLTANVFIALLRTLRSVPGYRRRLSDKMLAQHQGRVTAGRWRGGRLLEELLHGTEEQPSVPLQQDHMRALAQNRKALPRGVDQKGKVPSTARSRSN